MGGPTGRTFMNSPRKLGAARLPKGQEGLLHGLARPPAKIST